MIMCLQVTEKENLIKINTNKQKEMNFRLRMFLDQIIS